MDENENKEVKAEILEEINEAVKEEPVNATADEKEFLPVSVWTYVGFILLFAIPCAGFILQIVFACGASNNKNITNLARAYLVIMGIVFVLYLLLMMLGLGAGIMAGAAGALSGY